MHFNWLQFIDRLNAQATTWLFFRVLYDDRSRLCYHMFFCYEKLTTLCYHLLIGALDILQLNIVSNQEFEMQIANGVILPYNYNLQWLMTNVHVNVPSSCIEYFQIIGWEMQRFQYNRQFCWTWRTNASTYQLRDQSFFSLKFHLL